MIAIEQDSKKNIVPFYDRVWSDEAFAKRLETDVKAAVAEYFGPIAEGIDLTVVRDTPTQKFIHVPATLQEGEVADRDLMSVQGGVSLVDNTFGLSCPTTNPISITISFVSD